MTISAENDVSQPGRSRRSVISARPSLRVYFSCFCSGGRNGDYCGEVAVVASRSTAVGGHLGAKCEYRVRAVLKPSRRRCARLPFGRPVGRRTGLPACVLALTTAATSTTALHLPIEEPRPLIFRRGSVQSLDRWTSNDACLSLSDLTWTA